MDKFEFQVDNYSIVMYIIYIVQLTSIAKGSIQHYVAEIIR